MDIRVVRALWGKLEWFKDEIPNKPLFNEVVVVWGEENFNYLKSLGYDCIFVSSDAKVKDPDSIEAVVEVYSSSIPWYVHIHWDRVRVQQCPCPCLAVPQLPYAVRAGKQQQVRRRSTKV